MLASSANQHNPAWVYIIYIMLIWAGLFSTDVPFVLYCHIFLFKENVAFQTIYWVQKFNHMSVQVRNMK